MEWKTKVRRKGSICTPFSYWKIKNGITIAGRKVYTVRKVLADFAVYD